MCLLVIAYRSHPDYKLIVAANRDEFYDRPAAPATFWDDAPEVLAGRDLVADGTWLGITRNARIAAIANYRDPSHHIENAPSRGLLVRDYLSNDMDPKTYLDTIRHSGPYNGFNLVCGNLDSLYYYSNRDDVVRELSPGLYGLSNHLLNSPWPKVERSKKALAKILSSGQGFGNESILEILSDQLRPDDDDLPDTGIGLEWERILSPIFVTSDLYGTRASTVIMIDNGNHVTFVERSFDGNARCLNTAAFELKIPAASCSPAEGGIRP